MRGDYCLTYISEIVLLMAFFHWIGPVFAYFSSMLLEFGGPIYSINNGGLGIVVLVGTFVVGLIEVTFEGIRNGINKHSK